jgi:hypothetical protein
MPFGEDAALIQEIVQQFAKGKKVSAWLTSASGQTCLHEYQG